MSAQQAAHRAQVLAGQLTPNSEPENQELAMAPTAAEEEPSYSVLLPETLSGNKWIRLVDTFPAPHDDIHTLYDNLESSVAAYGDTPYLGHRTSDAKGQPGPYVWQTYSEVAELRSAIGSGMQHLGIQSGAAVGLYSINQPEWCLVDAACHAYSMVSVPLYDTLGPDTVKYICNHAELAAVACSIEVLGKLLEVLAECPTVRLVVVYGTRPHQRLPDVPSAPHCKVLTLDRVRALGCKHPKPHHPPQPSDVALINYTSGTTGVPKGAVITHSNIIANAAGAALMLTTTAEPLFRQGDRHICYLPLAHIYERFNFTLVTHFGAAAGFYRGNVLELLEDIQELRPTLFSSVPRLWNRIYDKVMAQIQAANPVSRALFNTAYRYKQAALRQGDLSGGRLGPFWDRLVFSKIKARVGGEVRLLTSGASPISAEVFDFLRICFGAAVIEGYGMTESSCLISMTPPGDPTAGHVGPPSPACEVKLDDIPEMGYTNADLPHPRGEICVRGPIIFRGYLKDEANTRDAVDAAGWLHTGDVGTWIEGGRLKIIDRKKNIFKLAQGEYVAPEKIEGVYARSPFVMQSFVYGNSLASQLVAVVIPDPDYLLPWAKERGLPADLAALCQHPQVVSAALKSMQEEGRAAGLKGFEQISAIHLHPEPFTVENGMMTPTFKLKRPQAQTFFQQAIDEMYSKLPAL
ncbi:Long chain acyl-CoA synthetase 7 [Chlorella vulgaris]